MHYIVGKNILDNTNKDILNERILYITNQLNSAIKIIRLNNEEFELAKLNLLAGERARSTAAFESALNYFKTGIDLVKGFKWDRDYSLILHLYEGAAESAYLSAQYELMYEFADIIKKNVKNNFDLIFGLKQFFQRLGQIINC